jgi:endonuclease/exonuclease/phosphatase family metal-dependent hydrolase
MSPSLSLSRIATLAVAVPALLATVSFGGSVSTAVTKRQAAAPPVRAAAGEGPVTMLTFNMCGEHCNSDSTGADITDLMGKIDTYQPAVVLLQEACDDQFTALESLSQMDDHWALFGYADATEQRGCDNGHDSFGDAILTHTDSSTRVHVKSLHYVHGKGKNRQTRKVICLRSSDAFPRATEVCTVHAGLDFEIGKAHQAAQIKQAYHFARKQDPTIPLVFGGDFNVAPSSNALDVVYFKGGGGASGAMEEVDACPGKHGRAHHSATCNQHTHDKTPHVKHRTKNDFIFGSRKSFKGLSGTVVPSSYSDHDMLVGHLYECASGVC